MNKNKLFNLMQHFSHLNYHSEKYYYRRVGDLLLHSIKRNSLIDKNTDLTGKLSTMNSFDKKYKNKSYLKEFEKSKKGNNNTMLGIFNASKVKGSLNNLSRNNKFCRIKKKIPFLQNLYSLRKNRIISSYKDRKVNNDISFKKSKSLLYEKFPSLQDDIYNLDEIYKKRELIRKKIDFSKKNIINITKDSDINSFRKNIKLKIKILKSLEKQKKFQKNLMKKIYYKLGDKEYNNVKKIIENRPYNINIKKEEDPFKYNEYQKNFKRLQKEYSFYPYNYLEEHKNLEPEAFKFMVNNFNSAFSLFGTNYISKSNKTIFKTRNSKINQKNKPSQIYIERIKKFKSKEERKKIKLN